jgi:hypothetical protein
MVSSLDVIRHTVPVQDADRRMVQQLQHTNAPARMDDVRKGFSPDPAGSLTRDDPIIRKENERLRTELDAMRQLVAEGAGPGGMDMARLRIENARIVAERNSERTQAISLGVLLVWSVQMRTYHIAVDLCCRLATIIVPARNAMFAVQTGESSTRKHAPSWLKSS